MSTQTEAEKNLVYKTLYTLAYQSLKLIAKEPPEACQCGSEIFADGDQCPICFAICMVEHLDALREQFNAG